MHGWGIPEWIMFQLVAGTFCAVVATRKGRRGFVWFIIGFCLPVIGIGLAVGLPRIQKRKLKKCSYCAEDIQFEAIKCRYCSSEVEVPVIDQPEIQQESIPKIGMLASIKQYSPNKVIECRLRRSLNVIRLDKATGLEKFPLIFRPNIQVRIIGISDHIDERKYLLEVKDNLFLANVEDVNLNAGIVLTERSYLDNIELYPNVEIRKLHRQLNLTHVDSISGAAISPASWDKGKRFELLGETWDGDEEMIVLRADGHLFIGKAAELGCLPGRYADATTCLVCRHRIGRFSKHLSVTFVHDVFECFGNIHTDCATSFQQIISEGRASQLFESNFIAKSENLPSFDVRNSAFSANMEDVNKSDEIVSAGKSYLDSLFKYPPNEVKELQVSRSLIVLQFNKESGQTQFPTAIGNFSKYPIDFRRNIKVRVLGETRDLDRDKYLIEAEDNLFLANMDDLNTAIQEG